jgi:DNA-binding NarL/FixJ family response regulator
LASPGLSPRLRQIARLVALGCTSYQIGRRLGLREKTIESHRSRIAAVLGEQDADIAGLTRLAVAAGWIDAGGVSARPAASGSDPGPDRPSASTRP